MPVKVLCPKGHGETEYRPKEGDYFCPSCHRSYRGPSRGEASASPEFTARAPRP